MPPTPTDYLPRGVSQLDGSLFARVNCMAAAGATALDDDTRGRIRTTGKRIRELQTDMDEGIGLDDVAVAWRRGWNRPFDYGSVSTTDLLNELRASRGAVVPTLYSRVPRRYRAQANGNIKHAVFAAYVTGAGQVRISDPIRGGWTWWPWTVLAAAAAGYAGPNRAQRGRGRGGAVVTPPPSLQVPGPGDTPGVGQPGGRVQVVLATPPACSPADAIPVPGGGPFGLLPNEGVFAIPRARLSDPCVCPAGYNRGIVTLGVVERLTGAFAGWVPPEQLTAGQGNACVRSDLQPGSVFGQTVVDPVAGAIGQAVGDAAATLGGAIGEGLRQVAILGALLALVVLGLYLFATSGGSNE